MSAEAAAILEIGDLTVARAGAARPELERFSLKLGPRETVVLLGETGCGKEALFRALLNAAGPGEKISGSIRFGEAPVRLNGKADPQSGVRIAYLPSAAAGTLSPNAEALSQFTRILARRLGGPRSSAREELRIALGRIENAPPLAALRALPAACGADNLAFGFLAAAIAQAPDLVLADHPLSELSPTRARAFANALIAEQKRLGFALLYAARGTLVTTWLDGRVLVMRAGRVIEEGAVARLASPQAHAYTQTLYRALPAISAEATPRRSVRSEPILQVRGLKPASQMKPPRGDDGMTFDLRRGQGLALLGEAGSGRRGLLRAMLGLDKPGAGRTVFDSVDIGILSRAMVSRLRRRIAFVTGDDNALDPRMTVRDTVEEPLRAHLNIGREHVAGHRDAALKRVGLNTLAPNRTVAMLSPFDRRRLQIARAIVSVPRLAVIEEPQRGLGPLEQSIMLDLLQDFRAQEGPAFLILTANFALARALADEAMVIREGRVIERGAIADLIAAPKSAYTKSLIEAVLPRGPEGLPQGASGG